MLCARSMVETYEIILNQGNQNQQHGRPTAHSPWCYDHNTQISICLPASAKQYSVIQKSTSDGMNKPMCTVSLPRRLACLLVNAPLAIETASQNIRLQWIQSNYGSTLHRLTTCYYIACYTNFNNILLQYNLFDLTKLLSFSFMNAVTTRQSPSPFMIWSSTSYNSV